MTCSVASVHPISFGSKEKTWWNSNSRATAFWPNSGGHSLRQSNPPSFQRVARRRSCLCCIDNLAGSGLSSSSSFNCLSLWDSIGSGHSADCSPPGQVDRPAGEVPQHEGNISTTILKLSVCPHNIQSIWEVCFILGVGCLHHDIQSVSHHHHPIIF